MNNRLMRILVCCGLALGALCVRADQDDGVYQWACDLPDIVSKETGAPSRAYLWIPPQARTVSAVVLAQHNMLEEPILAHPAFRKELARANVAIVWITPLLMPKWDRLEDNVIPAIEKVMTDLAAESGHKELAAAPLMPFGHSAMATYPYLLAAAIPQRVRCAVSIKGEWPEHTRPAWEAAQKAADARVPMLLVTGEYEDGYNRREKSREIFKVKPEATFSIWVDVGGGHFDWSDELCQGLGVWFAEMARTVKPKGVRQNGFWYPSKRLAKLVADYEALPRGKGKFTVLGYEYEGKVLTQNPKAHLQVVFGSKNMTFQVKPVFDPIVPEGRPVGWTGKKAGEANDRPAAGEEKCLVLQKIQGPVEYLGSNTWAVAYGRYDPRGYRSREATFQMVYPGSSGFKRSVQQGLVHIPWPKREFDVKPEVTLPLKGFSLDVPEGHGAYVREGPARVVGNRVVLSDVPRFGSRSLKVTVCVYDRARQEKPTLTTYRLTR